MTTLVTALLAALLRAPLVLAGTSDPTLIALTDDGWLVRFRASTPTAVERVRVDGAGGALVGIDVRPKNGRLYALSTANDLYEVDPTSGRATTVATLTTPFDGGTSSAFDFNPQSDRLRLIGANGQNLRVHPELGAAAVDGALTYGRNDPHVGTKPAVTAAAYTDAVADTPTTKLFDLDTALDLLVLQEPPNDGVVVTVGPLGIDCEPATGFDILTEDGVDRAYVASRSTLYSLDLATGRASALGAIGDGTLRIIGLAVLPASRAGTP